MEEFKRIADLELITDKISQLLENEVTQTGNILTILNNLQVRITNLERKLRNYDQ